MKGLKVTTMVRLDANTEFEMIETPDVPGPQLIGWCLRIFQHTSDNFKNQILTINSQCGHANTITSTHTSI